MKAADAKVTTAKVVLTRFVTVTVRGGFEKAKKSLG